MSGKLQKLRLDPGEIDVDAVEDRLIRQVAANRVRLREFFFDFDPLRSVRRVTALTIVMVVEHPLAAPLPAACVVPLVWVCLWLRLRPYRAAHGPVPFCRATARKISSSAR